ncbi:hypothetical protein niasHT_009090 [Heterodera trifolii]|uniref:Peptidase S72 domain-containing protein n=1 Tax=Heterodera trifolii TaxID=157864 RepID=A0ABD2M8S1_9BILA
MRMSDLRVFPRNYLRRYRTVKEVKLINEMDQLEGDDNDDDEDEDGEPKNGLKLSSDERMVHVLNISCGDLTDQASEVIDTAIEERFIFQVVQGVLHKNRPPVAVESTTASSTTRRTTRRVHNNQRPVVLNPLKTFHCQRRLLCRLTVDDNTFMDPEDGPTSRLALSAHVIGNHSNFLVPLQGDNRMEGVPLENGEYSFRLEARDRMGQANSVPFQVIVKEHSSREKPTHSYSLLMDVPLERFLDQPQFMRDFVYRLGASVHRISDAEATAEGGDRMARIASEIQVEELLDNGGHQTMLKWSNATLSRKTCDDRQINATRDRMMHASTERVRHDFLKAMGSKFHVRKVSRPVVFPDEVPHRDESSSADGSLATVTTPMLVEREQPPEPPPVSNGGAKMMMTMHENPLYRPPPQSQAVLKKSPLMGQHEHTPPPGTMPTSPRLGYQHRPSQQQQYSTFSPPEPHQHQQQHQLQQQATAPSFQHIDASPTPLRQPQQPFNPFLRDHHLQQSMRAGLTPVGQRMPPPYLAH